MAPQLLATAGPLAGQTLTLQPGENTLGREAGNSILLDEPAASRRHARIGVINGVATIEDLGSTSGTFVNEQRVAGPTLLKVGDSIRIGVSLFSFLPASIVPPDLGQRKPREQSRYKETPQPFTAPISGPMDNQGCMPDFSSIFKDLSGCLGPLMKYLIIAAIILLVLCLIGGIIGGIGALGALGNAANAANAAGGDTNPAPQHQPNNPPPQTPPPAQQPPAQQPPPQQAPPQTQATTTIEIVKIRVAYLKREGSAQPQPVVLVTWRNRGQDPIRELDGDIHGFDRANRAIGNQKKATLYKGAEVAPGQTHEPTDDEGEVFPVDAAQGQAPPILDHAEIDNLRAG
jgi:hypothetical protein